MITSIIREKLSNQESFSFPCIVKNKGTKNIYLVDKKGHMVGLSQDSEVFGKIYPNAWIANQKDSWELFDGEITLSNIKSQ